MKISHLAFVAERLPQKINCATSLVPVGRTFQGYVCNFLPAASNNSFDKISSFLTWVNDPIEEAFVKEAPTEIITIQIKHHRSKFFLQILIESYWTCSAKQASSLPHSFRLHRCNGGNCENKRKIFSR